MTAMTLADLTKRVEEKRREAQADRRKHAEEETLARAAGVSTDRASEVESAMVEIDGLQDEVEQAEDLLRGAKGDEELETQINAFLAEKRERLGVIVASVGNGKLVTAVVAMDAIEVPTRSELIGFATDELGSKYHEEMPSGEGSVAFEERKRIKRAGENLPRELQRTIWKVNGNMQDNRDRYFRVRWFPKSGTDSAQLIAEAQVYSRAFGNLHYRFLGAKSAYRAAAVQISRAGGTVQNILDGVVGAVVPARFTQERKWTYPRGEGQPRGEIPRTGFPDVPFGLECVGERRFVVIFPPNSPLQISAERLGIVEKGVERKVFEIVDGSFDGLRAVNGTSPRSHGAVQKFFCLALGIKRDEEEVEETTQSPTTMAEAMQAAEAEASARSEGRSHREKGGRRSKRSAKGGE